MRTGIIAMFVCGILGRAFGDESVADREKKVKELLAKEASVSMAGVPLRDYIGFVETMLGDRVPMYLDAERIEIPGDYPIDGGTQGTIGQVLQEALKPHGLIHFVWEGAVVISTEEGRKEFDRPEWCGLDRKEIEKRKDLAKKMRTVYDFEWSPLDPKKALEVIARKSGISIDSAAIPAADDSKEPDPKLLYPTKVSLFGALAFLSRSTGITFERTKEGGLKALSPKKKE